MSISTVLGLAGMRRLYAVFETRRFERDGPGLPLGDIESLHVKCQTELVTKATKERSTRPRDVVAANWQIANITLSRLTACQSTHSARVLE